MSPRDPTQERDGPTRKAGPGELSVLSTLYSAIKVSRLHTIDNVVVRGAAAELLNALASYLKTTDQVTILLANERIYFNEIPIPVNRGNTLHAELVELLEKIGVAGLRLSGRWSPESVGLLLGALAFTAGQMTQGERFAAADRSARKVPPPAAVALYDTVTVGAQLSDNSEATLSDSALAGYLFSRLIVLMEISHEAVRAGGDHDVQLELLRQTLMKLVDSIRVPTVKLRLLALTANLYDDALAAHAANVAVLSLAMGELLGLSRGDLVNLGYAALFHDIGRAAIGRHPTPQGEREDPAHVHEGLRLALAGRSTTDAAMARLVVITEHHRVVDGFPADPDAPPPHLFSRIVAIADAFDKFQNGTPWVRPHNPALALRVMDKFPERFEPTLVQLLRDVLGRTPRGTLLELKNGDVVVVLEGGARRGHKPLVRRLKLGDGRPDPERLLLELDLRHVKREANPTQVQVDWRREVLA